MGVGKYVTARALFQPSPPPKINQGNLIIFESTSSDLSVEAQLRDIGVHRVPLRAERLPQHRLVVPITTLQGPTQRGGGGDGGDGLLSID